MLRAKVRRSLLIAAAVCFTSFGLDQGILNATAAQTEEAALRAVVEKFYAAYGKKDLTGVMALWSEKAPDFATTRQTMQQQLANEDFTFGSPSISRIKVEGEKAGLRVTVELTAINTKSKQQRQERMVHNLAFVKESGEWKVWRYAAAVNDLAETLVNAKSDAERGGLLAEEKELVTVELVRALNMQGNRFQDQGNYPQALGVYSLAQSIGEQIGDKAGIAGALHNIGTVHGRQGNYVQAMEHFQRSLALREELGDKAGIASSLNNIGIVHKLRGNYAQAVEYYQKSLAIEEAAGNRGGIASALMNIGNVYQSQGNYLQALEYHQKSLAIQEALGNKQGIAYLLNNIGIVHKLQGNYAQAVEAFQKSLAMKEALGDKAGIGNSLTNIGVVYMDQGNYVQALEYLQKSLAIKEAIGDKAGIATSLNNIGLVRHEQGNYLQALEYYQKSLAIKETIGDKAGIAGTLNNIGKFHHSQSNYVRALEYFQKGLAVSESLGNKAMVALTLGNIGVVHGDQGDVEQELAYYQKSLAIREAMGDKAGVAMTLNNIGVMYDSQGNYAQALEYHQKSLAIKETIGDKAGIAASLNNIGIVHELQGNYEQALEYYQKSLAMWEAVGNKAEIAETLHNIGSVHKNQGRYSQALGFLGRAATMAYPLGGFKTLWRSHLTAGIAYRALNQSAQARKAFDEATKTIETMRTQIAGGEQEAQRFFANKLSPYLAMVDLLVTENKVAEALTYAERAKARVLLDALHNGRVNITKAMTAQEQEQERGLNNQLVSLNTQIFRENQREKPDKARVEALEKDLQKTRLEYEAFETNLYAAHPELKVRRGEAEILTLEEARALLPDAGTAALKFVVAEEKTSLFVLTKSAPGSHAAVEVKVFPIAIKQKDLEERVKQFRDQVAERDQAFAKNAAAMFQLLIAPARPLLQGKTTLIIVPDGPLWELPFQALQSPENRYLLQDYTVFYAPSLTVLREMVRLRRQNRAPATTPTLLAVGNPALGQQTVKRIQDATMDEKLGPLPAAQRQAEELGKLYGQQRSKVYTGADATEERVKTESANYNILHLAAHGALNNRRPMYSHIVLSQMDEKGKEDGLLEAWELMKLDLKADLAVLSACETARGRVVGGEGVIGLTWALFVAGCPTTVVSQWKVNDRSTADLMVEFHKQLKKRSASSDSQNSIAQALRKAALKLLDKSQYQHPYYWAGFIVVGDGY